MQGFKGWFVTMLLLVIAVMPCRADDREEVVAAWHMSNDSVVKNDTEKLIDCYTKIVEMTDRESYKRKILREDDQFIIGVALFANTYLAEFMYKHGNKEGLKPLTDDALEWSGHCRLDITRINMLSRLVRLLQVQKDYSKTSQIEKAYHDALAMKQYNDALKFITYLLAADVALGKGSMANKWLIEGRRLMPLVKFHHLRRAFNETAMVIYEKAGQWRDMENAFADYYHVAARGSDMAHNPGLADEVEKTVRMLREKADEQLTQFVSDSIRRDLESMPHPIDTVTVYEAGKDSIEHHIKYVRVRNLRILKWGLVVIAGLLLLFGIYVLWQRHVRKKRELLRYIEGLEEERNRLAKELHDGVSNQLLAVEMKLNSEGATEQTRQLLSESREQVRRVSHELMPPEFSYATLDEIVVQYINELNISSTCDISCHLIPIDADWGVLPAEQALEIYRIIQEAVGNAMKHADATSIAVGMHKSKEDISIIISDDGTFQETTGTPGIGGRTMRQRAASIGGELSFEKGSFGSVVKLVVK